MLHGVTRRTFLLGGATAVLGVGVVGGLQGCGAGSPDSRSAEFVAPLDADGRPTRFRIVPDDYHVPYAGVAEDGRLFFLSAETFYQDTARSATYVSLFLWKPDGSFDELRVDPAPRPSTRPPGQASAGGDATTTRLLAARLAELGAYRVRPIEVEPFTRTVDGVTFGWLVDEFEGVISINIMPGDFIAYYAPFDGIEYST